MGRHCGCDMVRFTSLWVTVYSYDGFDRYGGFDRDGPRDQTIR